MDLSYSHAQSQRVLKQRNVLVGVSLGLAALSAILGIAASSRDREIILQPVLRSPLTLSSSGVSREYLEAVSQVVNDTLLTSAEMRTFNSRLAALTSGRLVVGPDPITRSQARALWQATKAFAAPVATLAPLRSPRRRVNELHRTGAVVAISAVALSGCATLGGNVKGSFACRAPTASARRHRRSTTRHWR